MPVRQMLAAALRQAPAGPPDRDLLARFVSDRDEEAFAGLVRRHGPMVLGVCRRVTGHAQDAEDAFQAAFLVLARRAARVSRPELLGNWLYGVAYRTASEARRAGRRVKEQAVPDDFDPAAREQSPDLDDLRRVVDEELHALPERYRAAVVLCELEGVSRKDAAARLRVPEGTLSSRLAHARKLLAGRLAKRGITSAAGAVAAAVGPTAGGAGLPPGLVQLTSRAAARLAAGGAVPPGLVSSRVETLTDGVLKAMIVTRLKMTAGAAVLGLGMLGLGAATVIGQPPAVVEEVQDLAAAAQPPAATPKRGAAKTPKPAEKVAAKGVEDDDVPYPSVPVQAVVRLEDGKIVVRQRRRAEAVAYTRSADGRDQADVQPAGRIAAQKLDASDVSVFDMEGNRVLPKKWKDVLAKDVHALVAFDGRLPHPRELTLFKPDVLLIVFPAGTGGGPNWAPPGGQYGGGYPTSADGLYVEYPAPNGTAVYPASQQPAFAPPVTTVPAAPPPATQPATIPPVGR